VRRSTRLGWQLLVGSWALILFLALSLTADYLDYLSGSMELADTVQYAGMAVIATVLLYTNLSLAGGMGDLRRIIAAVIVGGGIVAAVAVSDHAESMENRLAPNYSHTLKPPFLEPSRADTIEQFIEESGKIFKE